MGHEEYVRFVKLERSLHPEVDEVYLDLFKGGRIHRHDMNERGLFYNDLEITLPNKKTITIEEKFRSSVWGDMAIELLQDIKSPITRDSLGWYFVTESDYISYVMKSNQNMVIYLVRTSRLHELLPSLVCGDTPHVLRASKKGVGFSINLCVDWKYLVDANIAKKIHG